MTPLNIQPGLMGMSTVRSINCKTFCFIVPWWELNDGSVKKCFWMVMYSLFQYCRWGSFWQRWIECQDTKTDVWAVMWLQSHYYISCLLPSPLTQELALFYAFRPGYSKTHLMLWESWRRKRKKKKKGCFFITSPFCEIQAWSLLKAQ